MDGCSGWDICFKMMLLLLPNVGGVAVAPIIGAEQEMKHLFFALYSWRDLDIVDYGLNVSALAAPEHGLKSRMCCNVDYVHCYVAPDWACDRDGDNSTDTGTMCDDPVLLTTFSSKGGIRRLRRTSMRPLRRR